MAFYLQFDGINDYVTFTTVNNAPVDIEIDFFTDIGRTPNTFQRIIDAQGFALYVRNNNAITFSGDTATAGPISFEIDGVLQNWTSNGTQYVGSGLDTMAGKTLRVNGLLSGFTHLMAKVGGSEQMGGGISAVRVYPWDSNTVIHEYDPSASNGTGQILPDTEGGNDGTLVNFPTDNSQWIFYDDGGGSVDVTITLDSGTYSLSGTDVSILKDSFLKTEIGNYLKEGQPLGLLSQKVLSTELGEYAYSGQLIGLLIDRYINLDSSNYTYLGNDAEILYNRSLPFDTGSYTKDGSNVNLVIDRFLSTESGSYVYTGEDINLSYSQALTLTLGTGSYTYQGTDQGLLKDFLLPVEAGNYTYESSNVTFLADRRLPIQSGEYVKTGNSVNFVYEANAITYTLSLEEGSYLKQGTPLRMLANRLLPVDTGTYLYEGANSNLLYNRVVALDSGMYSSAGTDLGLRVNRRLQIENGNYSLTGTPITLSYTGEVLAILEGYSINYKQDAVNDCFYKQDILSIRYI